MHFETSDQNGVAIITLTRPRIDASIASDLRTALVAVVTGGARQLVVDMSRVTFIDSSGLGALVALLKATGEKGRVCVTGLTPTVATLFKLTRMDKVFRVQLTPAEAVLSLKAA